MQPTEQTFDLQSYLSNGVERVVKDALRATLRNPRQSAYMVRFAAASRKASAKRAEAERRGEHIPPFLIASITSECNLHCAGCYSRCTHATTDAAPVEQLTGEEWSRIFGEAQDLGTSFILLAGGEPLLRRDVIEAASGMPDILFPVFTNGIFVGEWFFDLLDKHRNLIPIMSMEGGREATDDRRGEGVFDRLITNMDEMKRRGLIFGVSVTVTTENLKEVSSGSFLRALADRGCKAVIYVEYVPVGEESADAPTDATDTATVQAGDYDAMNADTTAVQAGDYGAMNADTAAGDAHLAPGDAEREYLAQEIDRLRSTDEMGMMYISFPGDEKSSGGCLAAGRGFFHINSHGGAEPCPFSPYSDINVRDTSLREALRSRLFTELQDGGVLQDDHEGGCVLHEKRALVEAIISSSGKMSRRS